MDFYECLMYCAGNEEFVREFDRLHKTNLMFSGSPIEIMIDKASGRQTQDIELFINVVYDVIWTRLAGVN